MEDAIVKLKSGFIRGYVEKHEDGFNYYSFKGIPYAHPPIGELRFQDPVPVENWTGVIDCKDDSPDCLQTDPFLKSISYVEDCLYLNVYTRFIDGSNDSNPVIVAVHVGGFIFGSASSLVHGPDYLIRKNIVLVVPSYRVGVLGFLNLEDEIAPGNQGLKDLALVLQWVQRNIRILGGDPNNVTLYGLMAGGAAAQYLALSSLTKGLIHKVISGNGVAFNAWAEIENPKSNAIKLCSLLGKRLTDSREILKFLKSVDTKSLHESQDRLGAMLDHFAFGPGTDNKSSNPFMPDRIATADQAVHLPYIVGWAAQEGLICLHGRSKQDFIKFCNLDFERMFKFGTKNVLKRNNLTEKQVRRLYYKNEMISEKNLDKFVDFGSDVYFLEGIQRVAKVQANTSSAPTYLYQFSYNPPDSVSKMLGCSIDGYRTQGSHVDQWPFLFKIRTLEEKGLPCLKKGTQCYKIMEQLTEMWANFARYGRPTVELSDLTPVHWQPNSDGILLRYLNIDEYFTMQSTVNVDQKLSSARDIKVIDN